MAALPELGQGAQPGCFARPGKTKPSVLRVVVCLTTDFLGEI